MDTHHFPCPSCGADLTYEIGTEALTCAHCGHEAEIPHDGEAEIEELNLSEAFARVREVEDTIEATLVGCQACGADFSLPPGVTAGECPFCGSAVTADVEKVSLIKPRSLLPFVVDRDAARERFRTWLGGLWLAPGDLQGKAKVEGGLNGMYVPYWTYDALTITDYTGQRGKNRTEYYTNSEGERKSRTVTDWYPASGRVRVRFDDILVLASDTLPKKMTDKLTPWDLDNLVPYDPSYLAGFSAERYHVDVERGFDEAKVRMEPGIERRIRRDIGGDKQRILSHSTRYFDTTFKHILLPIWIASYRYGNETYRFVINGRTGEVQAGRPWSLPKIAALVVSAVALIGGGILFHEEIAAFFRGF